MTGGEQLYVALSLASIVGGIVLLILGGRARVRGAGRRTNHAGLFRVVFGAVLVLLPLVYLVVQILLAIGSLAQPA